MCVFPAMFGFLPELLSVCLWTICLATHRVSMMDVPVHVRSWCSHQIAVVNLLLSITAMCVW